MMWAHICNRYWNEISDWRNILLSTRLPRTIHGTTLKPWVQYHFQIKWSNWPVGYFMTYAFIGESRSSSRLFLLSKIFLTWTYHKQKWLIQILGLKLSQNRSQDRFGTWYVHVKEIFDKRKKAWKKLALHRGSTGFRSQIWQQTHMHGAVSVEPNYIEVHKLRYW